jgi:hypothetical protein
MAAAQVDRLVFRSHFDNYGTIEWAKSTPSAAVFSEF